MRWLGKYYLFKQIKVIVNWIAITTYCHKYQKEISLPLILPIQPPMQWVPGSLPGVKRLGRGVDHTPSSSAEVKERLEVYPYPPCGPSWPVLV